MGTIAHAVTAVCGESEQTNASIEDHAVRWESGKLLTAEQTVRLACMSGVDRDQEVQLIAANLRRHAAIAAKEAYLEAVESEVDQRNGRLEDVNEDIDTLLILLGVPIASPAEIPM